MLTIPKLTMTLGGRTLFEEANLTINWGERVALVGPNGAGKSTLFHLILGDETPDSEPGRDEPVTDELEPLDLLAGLELHPADSSVDGALDALNAIEHRVDSTGLGDDSAETTERFSLDATAVPESEPTVAEDVAQIEPVVTDASYEETRDIETSASDDTDTDHLGYAADAAGTDHEDDEYVSDDGGGEPS